MNQHFMPGGANSNLRKLIHYQSYFPENSCNCIQPQKYIFASQSVSESLPYNERISQIISTTLGGRIHFGNYYLLQPLTANYLGKYEGQPGGGGKPIRNRF